jgi:Phytanoyl-CoA dioxygenase (PhyH)
VLTIADFEDSFNMRGVAIIEHALTVSDLAAMDAAFPQLGPRIAGGRKDVFSVEAQGWFSNHAGLNDVASRLLRTPLRLSRMQAFDKSAGANWFVPWHQDRAEDGRERPVAILEQTVALRIHLDDCDESNGPLEVIAGSHQDARLDMSAIADIVAAKPPLLCLAKRGDILAMRPLIIHRSQRAQKPAARRVIHLEYTAVLAPDN